MLRFLHRRPVGWLVLCVIASVMATGALMRTVLTLAAGELLGVAFGVAVSAFWYWIAAGAYRRTNEPLDRQAAGPRS